jgi:VWFA-related protein
LTRAPFGLTLALGLVAAQWPVRSLAQTVREKVDVKVVTVRVTARDRSGNRVDDLKTDDLTLSIDGKTIPIDTLVLTARELSLPRPPAPIAAPPPTTSAAPAAARPPDSARQMAIFVDESSTKSFDRRDVFDQLTKFVRQSAAGERLILVSRFDGSRLVVESPWSSDTAGALAAMARMREHPTAERLPTISELQGSNTSLEEVWTNRERLCRALLEALVLFPREGADRQLVFASGGTAVAHEADVAVAVSQQGTSSSLPMGKVRDAFEAARQPERDTARFELWSRAVNPGHFRLTIGDVVAKANERDVTLVPIAAEPVDRDRSTSPGAFAENRTSAAGASGSATGTTPVGTLRPSSRLGVAQAMWEIAKDTGGEPVLSPGKTAARLDEIGGRSTYELTFRDPAASDASFHRIEITSPKAGVTIEYRRAYRVPTEEDRTLDTVVARLVQPARVPDPLATVTLADAQVVGRNLTRVTARFVAPRESNSPDQREFEFVGIGEKSDGERTEPVRWTAAGRRVDDGGDVYQAVTNLGVPYGPFHWSIAITDIATGLTAFADAAPSP